MQQQGKWDGRSGTGTLRARVMYRAVATLSNSVRFAGTVTGENERAVRPSLFYEPPAAASPVFVNTALLHYRAGELESPWDETSCPRVSTSGPRRLHKGTKPARLLRCTHAAQDRLGGQRFQVTPFVYGTGGNEPRGEREHGAGSLAEFDLLGTQRTVLGVTFQRSSASNGDR